MDDGRHYKGDCRHVSCTPLRCYTCRQALEEIERDVRYKEAMAQVEQLLYTPLLALKNSPIQILFVIDALEECRGETSQRPDDTESWHAVTSMLEVLVRPARPYSNF